MFCFAIVDSLLATSFSKRERALMEREWLMSKVNVWIVLCPPSDPAPTTSASVARHVSQRQVTPTEQQLKSEAYQLTRVFVTAVTTKRARRLHALNVV